MKSGERFAAYAYKQADGTRVRLVVQAASVERDNAKGAQQRHYLPVALHAPGTVHPGAHPSEWRLAFEHRALTDDEAKAAGAPRKARGGAAAEAADTPSPDADDAPAAEGASVQDRLVNAWFAQATLPAPVDAALLQRHALRYAKGQSTDFFVHPQLGAFLRDELDHFLQTEFVHLWDVPDAALARERGKLAVARDIGRAIITVLAALEDLQAALLEKRKFVMQAHYLVMCSWLAKQSEAGAALVKQACGHAPQVARWRQWLGEPAGSTASGAELLARCPHLPLDTSPFDEAFQWAVLAEVPDVQGALGGLLVHGDNCAALRTLQAQWREGVKCVCIDPPYNTGNDGFIYRDSCQHASWASLVHGRAQAALQQFLATLALEGVNTQVLHVPVTLAHEPLAGLGLKTLRTGDQRFSGCVAFDPGPDTEAGAVAPEHLCIDPQLRASAGLAGAQARGPAPVLTPSLAGFVDAEVAFQHALQVKRRQGLVGLVFSSGNLQRWLARCTVRAPQGWFEHRELGAARRATAALQALEAGLVRAWRQAERRWRMEQLAVVTLDEGSAGLPQQMVAGEPRKVWRVEVDVARGVNDTVLAALRDVVQAGLAPAALIADVQAVLARHGPHLLDLVPRVQALIENHAELHRDALELPLPRLHGLPHLFTPLLAEKALPSGAAQPASSVQLGLFDAADWTPNAAVQIRPPALNPGETTFVWNVRAWWQEHYAHAPWNEVSLYLLRNPAAGGLRLWRDSGFAPDFMLWLQRGPKQVLGLIDPKGLARQWPVDKIELIAEFEARALSVPVRGALLSVSAPDAAALPPGQSGAPDALWSQRVLLQHDPQHLDRLMNHLLAALDAATPP